MPTLSRTVPEDIEGTIVRLLAYMGGLFVLSIAVAGFFRVPELVEAAPQPAPRPQWIDVERPHPAFDLILPEDGGSPTHYAILRREADDARKDILTWGELNSGRGQGRRGLRQPGDLPSGRRRRALHRCGQRDRSAHRRPADHRRRQACRRARQQIRPGGSGRLRHRRSGQAAPVPRLRPPLQRSFAANCRLVLQHPRPGRQPGNARVRDRPAHDPFRRGRRQGRRIVRARRGQAHLLRPAQSLSSPPRPSVTIMSPACG